MLEFKVRPFCRIANYHFARSDISGLLKPSMHSKASLIIRACKYLDSIPLISNFPRRLAVATTMFVDEIVGSGKCVMYYFEKVCQTTDDIVETHFQRIENSIIFVSIRQMICAKPNTEFHIFLAHLYCSFIQKFAESNIWAFTTIRLGEPNLSVQKHLLPN